MSVGLDSIGATELSTRLSERLKTELSPTLVFDHPTLQSIVSSLSIDYDLSIDSTVDASTQRHDEQVQGNTAVASTSVQGVIRDTTTILKTISAAVMEVLGSSPSVDTPLMSAGLDSIAVTEFVNILQPLIASYPRHLVRPPDDNQWRLILQRPRKCLFLWQLSPEKHLQHLLGLWPQRRLRMLRTESSWRRDGPASRCRETAMILLL